MRATRVAPPTIDDYERMPSLWLCRAFAKMGTTLVLLCTITYAYAQNYHTTTSDLNLRTGAGSNYASMLVLQQGDTVEVLDDSDDYWAQIQYQDQVGYAAKEYLQKLVPVEQPDNDSEASNKAEEDASLIWYMLLLIFVVPFLLIKLGDWNRHKSITMLLSFLFGFLGYQKFYLGKTWQGIFCIVFCWTWVPLIIGWIDLVRFAVMKDDKFYDLYNLGIRPAPLIKKVPPRKYNVAQVTIKPSLTFKQTHRDKTMIDAKAKKNNGSMDKTAPLPTQKYQSKQTDWDKSVAPLNKQTPNLSIPETKPTFRLQSKPIHQDQTTNVNKQTPDQSVHQNEATTSNHSSKQPYQDESIIDVNAQDFDLSIDAIKETDAPQQPPYWEQTYVYSCDELHYATQEQQQFYAYFYEQFKLGKQIDLQGNTNYAFILYFELIEEYGRHQDFLLLGEQFLLLGKICPKTITYTNAYLQKESRKQNDSNSVGAKEALEPTSTPFGSSYSSYSTYDDYKLGNLYKDQLKLSRQEIRWLNKLYNPTNAFLSIEGCCVATIKQYLLLLNTLEQQFKNKETSLAKEVAYIRERITKAAYHSSWGHSDVGYLRSKAESDLYSTLFKRIENSVRESFGHKRKLSSDFPGTDNGLSKAFEERIGTPANALIEALKDRIEAPDLATQLELNVQNVNRWKAELKLLTASFEKGKVENFIHGVAKLEEANQKNPNLEQIFLQAFKFLAKYDKVESLKHYAQYVYYDLKSAKIDHKPLPKTLQKSLFKTEEQRHDFETIIAELIATQDLEAALESLAQLYVPKRKRVQLDHSEIRAVEQKHKGTVELLNEYLTDEQDTPQETTNDEVDLAIQTPTMVPKDHNSIFIPEIDMNPIQEELVKRIVANSFEMDQKEVDAYALANGLFKNQLIDSINEACEDHLDGEPLIEEDGDNYIIEESYYTEIAK